MEDKKNFVLVTDVLELYVEVNNLKTLKVTHVATFKGNDDDPMNGDPCTPSDAFSQIENRYGRITAAVKAAATSPLEIITPMILTCKEARAANAEINSLFTTLRSEPAQVFTFDRTSLIEAAYQAIVNGDSVPEVQPHKTGAAVNDEKEKIGNKYLCYYYLKMEQKERPFTIICDRPCKDANNKDIIDPVNLNEKEALYRKFSSMTEEEKTRYVEGLSEAEKAAGLDKPQPVTLDDFEYPIRAEFRISPPLLAHLLFYNEANKLQLISKHGKPTVNFKQVMVDNEPQLESTTAVMIEAGEWEFAYGAMRAPVQIITKTPMVVQVAVDELSGLILYKYQEDEAKPWNQMKL